MKEPTIAVNLTVKQILVICEALEMRVSIDNDEGEMPKRNRERLDDVLEYFRNLRRRHEKSLG